MPKIISLFLKSSGWFTFKHESLKFMDSFLIYDQIKVAPKDEEHPSFTTGHEIYYYMLMPFRLENNS